MFVVLLLLILVDELLLEELLLGLTYSELERTWRLLLAGVYDLRSVVEGLVIVPDGLSALEGLTLPFDEGLVMAFDEGLALLFEGAFPLFAM